LATNGTNQGHKRRKGKEGVRLIEDSESNGFLFLLPSFDSKTPDLIAPTLERGQLGVVSS